MSEDRLQAATARLMRLKYRRVVAWHTPNGGHRNAVTAARLQGMGVRPGVPDWTLVLPGGRVGFVELKVGGNRQSVQQVTFMDQVRALGCPYVVARSVEEFDAAVEEMVKAPLEFGES